jgi:hypothetical protein
MTMFGVDAISNFADCGRFDESMATAENSIDVCRYTEDP